jgi:hypothetical protein
MKKSEGLYLIRDLLQTGTQFVRSLLGKRVSRKATGTSPTDLGKYIQPVSPSKRHSLGP